MSIVNQISVGDIMYYTIDSKPSHTAPKGSIAVVLGYGVTYRNNDGGTTWIRLIEDNVFCYSYFTGNATGRDTAIDTWTNLNTLGWVLPSSNNGFSLPIAGQITYTGTSNITLACHLTGTIEADDKWQDYESIIAKNNVVDVRYQGATGKAISKRCSMVVDRVTDMVTNDFLNVGVRWTAKEAGGGPISRTYIPTNYTMVFEKINEETPTIPMVLFTEDWESSGFTENSWTTVQDATNVWVVGQAEFTGGTSSAYVSNDGGSSATYTKTVADVSHFYMDFEFQSEYDTMEITFDWKCWGENAAGATQYDYGCVVITDTGTTVSAGAEVITTQAVGAGNGRIGASTNLGKFNEGYGGSDSLWRSETIDVSAYIGSTKRLVFTWKDDTTAGDDPPFVVDNIIITGFIQL